MSPADSTPAVAELSLDVEAEAAVRDLAERFGIEVDPVMVARLAAQLAGVLFGKTWEEADAEGLERASKVTDLATADALGRARR